LGSEKNNFEGVCSFSTFLLKSMQDGGAAICWGNYSKQFFKSLLGDVKIQGELAAHIVDCNCSLSPIGFHFTSLANFIKQNLFF
jgi:hypothetical protein